MTEQPIFGDPRLSSRFWQKVTILESGCWDWCATRNQFGYGIYRTRENNAYGTKVAHRILYLVLVGAIPEGLELDHLCRVRSCVNPDHLEVVTHRENLLRGNGIPARNAAKVACLNGHPYVTRVRPNGRIFRECPECKRAYMRKYQSQHREKMRDGTRRYEAKLKADPLLWAEFLQRKRERYYLRKAVN